MGWWASTIFGGDHPLDALGDIREHVGINIEHHGYGDPSTWRLPERVAWGAKASMIDRWAVDLVTNGRQRMRDAYAIAVFTLAAVARNQSANDVNRNGRLPEGLVPRVAEAFQRCAANRKGFSGYFGSEELDVARLALEELLADTSSKPIPEILKLVQDLDLKMSAWKSLTASMRDMPLRLLTDDERAQAFAVASSNRRQIRKLLETGIPEFDDELSLDTVVEVQVATALIVATGKPLSDELRAMALLAAKPQFDPWGGRSKARNDVLSEFAQVVGTYEPGKAYVFDNRGLMEAIEIAQENGQEGMINKGPGTL